MPNCTLDLFYVLQTMATYDDVKHLLSAGNRVTVKELYLQMQVLRDLMVQGQMDQPTYDAFRGQEEKLADQIKEILTTEIDVRGERVDQLQLEVTTLEDALRNVSQPPPQQLPPLPQ